jgi:hypothetical protein
MSRPITIQERAAATEELAYGDAIRKGAVHQMALECGRYAARLVLTGASAHRALQITSEAATRRLIHSALSRAAKYADVRLGNDSWGANPWLAN